MSNGSTTIVPQSSGSSSSPSGSPPSPSRPPGREGSPAATLTTLVAVGAFTYAWLFTTKFAGMPWYGPAIFYTSVALPAPTVLGLGMAVLDRLLPRRKE